MTPARLALVVLVGALGSVTIAPLGCAGPHAAPMDPRYVAVHNTFAAMGMAEVGPIHGGSLAEGRDARFELHPGAAAPGACVAVFAFGGPGVRDVDLEIDDAEGHALGHDETHDASAVVRVCPPSAGSLAIVVKMTRGAGDFTVASWAGSVPGGGIGHGAEPSANGAGTCESPLPLAAGSITGNTKRGESELNGACGKTDAKELVYKLEVPTKQRVVLEVEPINFDSVLYVRKGECATSDAEVACNDDAATGNKRSSSSHGSRIDEVFEPGTYWVVVDGYNTEAGSFRMNVEITDVPTLAEACTKATPIPPQGRLTGTLTGAFNHGAGSCDHGAGPDVIHRIDVPQRARVRAVVHSDEFSPVVHLRKTCSDPLSELGCSDSGAKAEEAAVVGTLDRGAYALFADSADKAARGRYTVDVDFAPEQGAGVRGDACGDALPLDLAGPPIEGDTFAARDDMAPRCAAPGAPDTVYRFDVARRSRLVIRLGHEEGDHVFALLRSCTDRASEIACGSVIDEVLSPGPYWLVVDGTTKGAFGRYVVQSRARDVGLQEAACANPPSIRIGQTVTATTDGAPNRFTESCAGNEDGQTSGDRVYKLTLAARTHIQALLSTPNHDGVLAIRRTCIDPPKMANPSAAEVSCNNDGPDIHHSRLDTTLDAGSYWLVVDGHQGKHEGAFTLEVREVKTR